MIFSFTSPFEKRVQVIVMNGAIYLSHSPTQDGIEGFSNPIQHINPSLLRPPLDLFSSTLILKPILTIQFANILISACCATGPTQHLCLRYHEAPFNAFYNQPAYGTIKIFQMIVYEPIIKKVRFRRQFHQVALIRQIIS